VVDREFKSWVLAYSVVDREFKSWVLSFSAVDSEFKSWSGQTKDYKIGIYCFSAKHAALKRKSKD
jgi:hypothetical protein